jgi:chromosome segregation ATPase
MEGKISVTCSLITLTGFAAQASESLYQTIKRFPNSKRAARELRDEVQALLQELKGLKHLAVDYEQELSVLKLPLLQCGITCNGLSDRIDQCVKPSEGSRTRLEDWTRLQYLGESIIKYKNVLSNYKATINIALGGVTL